MQRTYPSVPIHAVAAWVIFEGRALLVLRRNPPSAGQWSVPGGAHELGETVTEAVVREVREETGLEITDLCLWEVSDILLRDAQGEIQYHYVITYYTARPCGGRPLAGDDVGEVRWASLDEAAALGLSRRLLGMFSAILKGAARPASCTGD